MTARESSYRADIQGLRGLSILMVLAFHAHQQLLPGGFFGVDVFFVISGFIITSLLLREMSETGTIDWPRFMGRRIKRLLPNASVVLVTVTLVGAFFLTPFEFGPLGQDVISAALYYSNFHFAATSVDYFLSNQDPSAVIHFWSLSIEEQFYLFWPLLLLLASRVTRHRQVVIGAILMTTVVASFCFCLVTVQTNQPLAFFHTGARVWELAMGAALALLRYRGRLNLFDPFAASIGIAGLLAIGLAAVMLNEQIDHPGWWTLLPVGGTVAVLLSGSLRSSIVTAFLARPVLIWLGDRSYSLYLWHWPAIVFMGVLTAQAWWSPWVGLAIGAVLAELAYRYVENPLRRRPWTTNRLRALASASVLLVVTIFAPVAAARLPDVIYSQERMRWAERISVAAADYGQAYDANCHLDSPRLPQPACLFGDPSAGRKIVLLGDSHAAHWFPAVKKAALDKGWQVHSWTKSSCPAASILVWQGRQRAPYAECSEWREEMLARIAADEMVKVIIMSSSSGYSVTAPDGDGSLNSEQSDGELVAGTVRTIERLERLGKKVILIHDTPVADVDYKDCMLANMSGDECGRSRATAVREIELRAAALHPAVVLVDVSDVMCGPVVCPVIIDGRIVYRDDSHMSATFAQTLAPFIVEALARTGAD